MSQISCGLAKRAYNQLLVERENFRVAMKDRKNWPHVEAFSVPLYTQMRALDEIIMSYLDNALSKEFKQKINGGVVAEVLRIEPKLANQITIDDMIEVDGLDCMSLDELDHQKAESIKKIIIHPRNRFKVLFLGDVIKAENFKPIIDGFSNQFCHIEVLHFDARKFGLNSEIVDLICAELIRESNQLQGLGIEECRIDDSGTEKIAQALSDDNCNLKWLDLSENAITDKGASALLNVLEQPHFRKKGLTVILSGNEGISPAMKTNLKKNRMIKMRSLRRPEE